MSTKIWGATPEEWNHLDLVCGLGRDLLPVVSNLKAEISSKSSLKELGKTPSRYTGDGKVVGIPQWTELEVTPRMLDKWLKNSDYGICIRTNDVRGLDCDISDEALAKTVRSAIAEWWSDEQLPKIAPRTRANSSKFLLAFRVVGNMPKRRMVISEDGKNVIEFLANGQQFIAIGTHTSGVRYEWPYGLPNEFPEVSVDQFERLWGVLVERFATEAPDVSTGGARRMANGVRVASDDMTTYLFDKGIALDEGREGQIFITCPFEIEHTKDSGISQTAYFPKGSRGYERGHFKCLHAHCMGRSDAEFEDAIGYRCKDFEDLDALDVANPPKPKPQVLNDKGEVLQPFVPMKQLSMTKNGEYKATLPNLGKLLARPDALGFDIRYDEFRAEIVITPYGKKQWRSFNDQDYVALREALEGKMNFLPITPQLMRDAVLKVAHDRRFDTAIEWINTLEWDGVPRVEEFYHRYFGAADSDYIRAVSRYTWTALAGRVIQPGCKADMVPILKSEQGTFKSTSIEAIAPSSQFFVPISFADTDETLARKMRGCLVAEVPELKGLHSRDLETIKAFITRTEEKWVPKFKEFTASYSRRLIFIGTTNQNEFLADDTGNRRWLPFEVVLGDIEAIRRDRLQLWAEAAVLFLCGGVDYKEAATLAVDCHEQYMLHDPWEDVIAQWLATPDDTDGTRPCDRPYITMVETLAYALHIDHRNVRGLEAKRAGAALRKCGYTNVVKRIDDGLKKVWVLKLPV